MFVHVACVCVCFCFSDGIHSRVSTRCFCFLSCAGVGSHNNLEIVIIINFNLVINRVITNYIIIRMRKVMKSNK